MAKSSGKVLIDPQIGEVVFRKSLRSRSISIRVHPVKGVSVSVPYIVPYAAARLFFEARRGWVLETMARQKEKYKDVKVASPTEIEALRRQARKELPVRLAELAARYGLKADTIILVNGLKRPSDLKTGDIVTIPNQDGRLIQIKANDSIYKIAERYGVSWKKIVDCNNLSDINIKSGMKLFIPDSQMTKYEREKFYQIKPKKVAPVVNSKQINKSVRKNITTSGIFSWPVKGAITSSYGYRSDPITGVKDFHTGLDIRGAMNTPVKAPSDGIVAYTGWSNIYGNFILIKHDNNIVTMYGHLNKINVKKEDNVTKGSTIGAVGSTGRSTGPHLHFEILKNNKRDNPLNYLSMEK